MVQTCQPNPERGAKTDLRQAILNMQWDQSRHDELYHRDIVRLPVADRIRHMTLHLSKYTGRIAEALGRGDAASIGPILVDTWIIALVSANALGFSLGQALCDSNADSAVGLQEVGVSAAHGLRADDPSLEWLLPVMARHVGRLAKACESLDHLEAYPYRESMISCVAEVARAVAAAAALRRLDLKSAMRIRLREVEERHIFHEFFEREPEKAE